MINNNISMAEIMRPLYFCREWQECHTCVIFCHL